MRKMARFSDIIFVVALSFLGFFIFYSFFSVRDVMLDNTRLEREMTNSFRAEGFNVTYRKIRAHENTVYFEGSRENWREAFNDYCACLEEHGICEVYVIQGYPKYYASYDDVTIILVIPPMI